MSNNKTDEIKIDDRRKMILEELNREGKIKVSDLSKKFNISEVTIRNDLSDLEQMGMLERIHGGAVSTHKAYYRMSLKEKMQTNQEEKRSIAAEIASMISDGDSIMMDSGTTTLFVAKELKNLKGITVLTNSLAIAEEIGYRENISVILLGGSLYPKHQFTYGDDVINQLKKYKADIMILAADGVSAEEGITTYHYLESEVSRQMMARASKTIVAADFSKIGRVSFAYIDSIENVDVVVTNTKANKEEIELIRKKGVEVKLA